MKCVSLSFIEVNMSAKRITGLIVLIVGIILIIFSVHSMNRISNAKGGIHTLTDPFSGSSGGREAGSFLQGEASQYDTTVKVLLIGGIVLTVIGAGVTLFGKKKKR